MMGPLLSRRLFLKGTLAALGGSVAPSIGCGPIHGADKYGPLQSADANGIELPVGFTSRVVAEYDVKPAAAFSDYLWHSDPDGGAVFDMPGGGWVYVSNSETGSGGAGALRFDANANVIDAYSILSGTSANCAGGATPWGTWLSCEEHSSGKVWECDPTGPSQGIVRPQLGTFAHEAVAVDFLEGRLYLTEDRSDGRLYRFTPTAYPDLSAGVLEVAEAIGSDPFTPRQVVWHAVDPDESPTRYQVPQSTAFNGGEGIDFKGTVYFTTKGDSRVWAYSPALQVLTIVYSASTSSNPILTGVDNLMVTPRGDVFVAEDGGNQELIAITPRGNVVRVLHLVDQSNSEIAGPALTSDGNRLYFSSQRGGSQSRGLTYEITGPFLA